MTPAEPTAPMKPHEPPVRIPVGLALASTLLLAACSDDATAAFPASDAADVAADGTADGSDSGTDVAQDAAPSCADLAPLDSTFELDPDGPTTQIHVDAAFDGDGIWFAYNTVGDDSFDVWITRIDCAGTTTVAPTRLDTVEGPNVIEPQLAVRDDGLLVVWQSDDGVSEFNLDLVGRTASLDGTPDGDAEWTYELRRDGAAQAGNAWMPAVAATDDGYVLVAAWGHDEATAFQTFVQELDPDGQPVGDAEDVEFVPAVSQVYPDVAWSDGATLVGWTASAEDGDRGRIVRLGQGAFAVRETGAESASVALRGDVALTVGDFGGEVRVTRLDDDGAEVESAVLGGSEGVDHSGVAAIDPSGTRGAVMWYRIVNGFRNSIRIAGLDLSQGVGLASQQAIDGVFDAGPYTASLTAIGGGVYLLAWSSGPSPDFRAYGRFVRL